MDRRAALQACAALLPFGAQLANQTVELRTFEPSYAITLNLTSGTMTLMNLRSKRTVTISIDEIMDTLERKG